VKILVTGCNSQLAQELKATESEGLKNQASFTVSYLSRDELDICSLEDALCTLEQYKPHIVINTAAYTAVDAAENDKENAFNINSNGPLNLAKACSKHCAKLIHLSTDFVFDGVKSAPYHEYDSPNPLSVYGQSKLSGEQHVQQRLPLSHLIIRTSWLYSIRGNNFVKTMLRLIKEKKQLEIVADQIGSPTSANGLALFIWSLCRSDSFIDGRTVHWSDEGSTSWYEFAVTIQKYALKYALIDSEIPVLPILASEYPTAAIRPPYSVLASQSTFEAALEPWQVRLESVLSHLSKLSL